MFLKLIVGRRNGPMHIHTELPTGAQSRGYEVESEAMAQVWFERLKFQLTEMKFVGDLVLTDQLIRIFLGYSI